MKRNNLMTTNTTENRLLQLDALESLTIEQRTKLKFRIIERVNDDYENWCYDTELTLNCLAHLFFDYVEHVDSNARDWNQLTELEVKQFIERNQEINVSRLKKLDNEVL